MINYVYTHKRISHMWHDKLTIWLSTHIWHMWHQTWNISDLVRYDLCYDSRNRANQLHDYMIIYSYNHNRIFHMWHQPFSAPTCVLDPHISAHMCQICHLFPAPTIEFAIFYFTCDINICAPHVIFGIYISGFAYRIWNTCDIWYLVNTCDIYHPYFRVWRSNLAFFPHVTCDIYF